MIHEEIFKSKFAQGTLIWFMDFMSEYFSYFQIASLENPVGIWQHLLGCHQDGRWLAPFGGTVTLRLHRNPHGNLVERRAEAYVDDGKPFGSAQFQTGLL